MMERAGKVEDILKVTDPRPLKGEEFDRFYLNCDAGRGDNPTLKLKKFLSIETSRKVLLTGHNGTGKSTELFRLCREITQEFFTVTFSAETRLDRTNISYPDLVLVIMEQLVKQAEEHEIEIDDKVYQSVRNWFDDMYQEYIKEEGAKIEVEGGLSAVLARFTGKLMTGRSNKEIIRRVVERRIDQLIERCNILIREVEDWLLEHENRRILIVVDDLEKIPIDQQRRLFVDNASTLTALNCKVIYTVNMFLCYSVHANFINDSYRVEVFPTIKTHDRNWKPDPRGVDLIKDMLDKRMDLTLFETAALEKAIQACGGSFRDLLMFIEEATLHALDKSQAIINEHAMDFAIRKLKNRMIASISETRDEEEGRTIEVSEFYEELLEIHKNKRAESNLVTRHLFYLRAVLSYNGDDDWSDIHPLVKMGLTDLGLIK